MPVKRYNGTDWEVIAGDGMAGAPGVSPNPSRFVLVAERGASPTTGQYFAWGNGVATANDVVIPYSCTLNAMSLSAQTAFTGTFTLQVLKNGSSVASLSVTSGNTTGYSTGLNVSISPGDEISLYASAADVGGTVVVASAWFLN
jgi:hypothetical protein